MDSQQQNTHFEGWLGEGSLPLMRGLQLAHKLQAELHGLPLLNLEEANKSSFTQSLLASLLDIVSLLNDGIQKLSTSPASQLPENIPLKKRSHEHLCRESPNSLRSAEDCKRGPRKIADHASLQISRVKRSLPKCKFKLSAVEAGFIDGFTWRKYGQKAIQGKNHPRSYYRCMHKEDLKCPALKQVQECDGMASSFDITYIEQHTCVVDGACGGRLYGSSTSSKGLQATASGTSSSRIISANSDTSLGDDSMQVEPSLNNISEIEVEGEAVQDTISGSATSSARSLLYSMLNYEHEMPITPPLVSCTSLEKTADNSPKFPQVDQAQQQQQEESTHSDSPFPIYWDFDQPFPAFVDFEGQL